MRAALAHRAPPGAELGAGAALAVLYLVLACWFFARVHRYAVRTGLIARYSAESVS
jgi:ABC-2 type transport system permease protein